MKVVVTVRTLNESANIDRFCLCYQNIADEILVADGGSTDDTVEKVYKIPKVSVRPFEERIIHADGKTWSNPRGKHINFLFDWAMEREADWIIFDDCDCVPTVDLQQAGRGFLEFSGGASMVFAFRMFVRHDDEWYPTMNYAGQSLWAWRTTVPVRAEEVHPEVFTMIIPEAPTARLLYPNSLLHYFYPDDELMDKKIKFYNITGDAGIGTHIHPDRYMGKRESLPEWARWK